MVLQTSAPERPAMMVFRILIPGGLFHGNELPF
jgi:hypothetical protein